VGVRANLLSNDTWKGVLRANYGQGYRVPNLKERHYLFDHSSLGYIVLGNPNLKPESSNSFQLGGQLTWRDRVTLDANLFYNHVTDLIQTDMTNFTMVNGIAVYTYRNVARARTQGAETALRWRATNQLNLTAAYTYTHRGSEHRQRADPPAAPYGPRRRRLARAARHRAVRAGALPEQRADRLGHRRALARLGHARSGAEPEARPQRDRIRA
jgi:outer membrane receptor protein involved in Fe transport